MYIDLTPGKALLMALLYCSFFYSQEDIFMDIGLEKNETKRIIYKDFDPIPHSATFLESEVSDMDIEFPRITKIASKKEVDSLIDNLYNINRPFIVDFTGVMEKTRDSLELKAFRFQILDSTEYADFKTTIAQRNLGKMVNIPHYTGPAGRWYGVYKTEFEVSEKVSGHKRIFLNFGAVDYYCEVYLNGRFIKLHEGFFAPFKIDVTSIINRNSKNNLVVLIKNDSPALGTAEKDGTWIPDGNKIYGATGLGWDEPGYGWHHCPPGAGIWQKVYLEGTPEITISDINIIQNLNKDNIEVEIQIHSPFQGYVPVELTISVLPKNFEGPGTREVKLPTKQVGPGYNTIKQTISLKDYKVWDIKTPYLYALKAKINGFDLSVPDVQKQQFGMRSFTMDTESPIKGSFYLNGEQLILRGANTMGFMQNDVFNEDKERLIKDILLAKLANINFLRLTQRPVQPEVYEMCDNLGMLLQTDFPLFGYLQRTQFEEALKQVGEMEKLIRAHPSNILVSLINEPTLPTRRGLQRFLDKDELDHFYNASKSVIHFYNPKQVIKYADGDRVPPSRGYPDKHLYNTWYANHGIPIGKFIKGFWIGNKAGWKMGCGEYGSEGIESLKTMFKHYPKAWLPKDENDTTWTPGVIPKAQTWKTHQMWYTTPKTPSEWVEESQRHQAWSVETQTRAFRRQTQRINSTVVHHLIDAWPAGWMKAIIDYDRRPKKAYFKMKEALEPIIVDIRTDKFQYFAGDSLKLEFWINSDIKAPFDQGNILYEVRKEEVVFRQKTSVRVPSFSSKFIGFFNYKIPPSNKRVVYTVRLGLEDNSGSLINEYKVQLEVFPSKIKGGESLGVGIVGKESGNAWQLAKGLDLNPSIFNSEFKSEIILIDDLTIYDNIKDDIYKAVDNGGKLIFLEQPKNSKIIFKTDTIQVKKSFQGLNFLSINKEKESLKWFKKNDFNLWYNKTFDRIDFVARSYLSGSNLNPILTTGQWDWSFKEKADLPVFAELETPFNYNVYFCQLITDNGVKEQPALYFFLNKIIRED